MIQKAQPVNRRCKTVSQSKKNKLRLQLLHIDLCDVENDEYSHSLLWFQSSRKQIERTAASQLPQDARMQRSGGVWHQSLQARETCQKPTQLQHDKLRKKKKNNAIKYWSDRNASHRKKYGLKTMNSQPDAPLYTYTVVVTCKNNSSFASVANGTTGCQQIYTMHECHAKFRNYVSYLQSMSVYALPGVGLGCLLCGRDAVQPLKWNSHDLKNNLRRTRYGNITVTLMGRTEMGPLENLSFFEFSFHNLF